MRKYYAVSFKVKKNEDSVCIGDYTCVPFLNGTQKSGNSLIEVIKGADDKERFYFFDLKKSMFFLRPALGLPEVPFDELREGTISTVTDGDTVYIVYIKTKNGIVKLYDSKCKLNLSVPELANINDELDELNTLEDEGGISDMEMDNFIDYKESVEARQAELLNSIQEEIDAQEAMLQSDIAELDKDAQEVERINEAGSLADTNPTEAQKEAGNYKKGHTSIQGLQITI